MKVKKASIRGMQMSKVCGALRSTSRRKQATVIIMPIKMVTEDRCS